MMDNVGPAVIERGTSGVTELEAKARVLVDLVTGFESVVVAFSGGVDSAYLAHVAAGALGPKALAITANSSSYPEHHRAMRCAWRRSSAWRTNSSRPTSWRGPSIAPIREPLLLLQARAVLAPDGDCRARGFASSSMATTRTTAATTGPAGRRRASSACAARSTKPG